MKIVFLDAYTTNPGDIEFGDLLSIGKFSAFDRTSPDQFLSRSSGAEVLIVNKFPMTRDRIEAIPELRLICVAATGYNNVDIQAAREFGVVVSNVVGYSTMSVTQHIFSTLLSVTNRPQHYFEDVRKGRWSGVEDFCFYDTTIRQLSTFVFGIYGFGTIGAKVAEVANAFGMKVLASSRKTIDAPNVLQVEWDELLASSDILSLHVPLKNETLECINNESLNKMKRDAILINTGRGGLVNEDDLAIHLLSNPKFIAILDVLSQEPPPIGHPLCNLENCFITPHIAWANQSARMTLVQGIKHNIVAFIKGIPTNVVS